MRDDGPCLLNVLSKGVEADFSCCFLSNGGERILFTFHRAGLLPHTISFKLFHLPCA